MPGPNREQEERPAAAAASAAPPSPEADELAKLRGDLEAARAELECTRGEADQAKRGHAEARTHALSIAGEASEAVHNIAAQAEALVQEARQRATALELEAKGRSTALAADMATLAASGPDDTDHNNLLGFLIGIAGALLFSGLVFWIFILDTTSNIRGVNDTAGLAIFANAVRDGPPTAAANGIREQKWMVSGTVVSKDDAKPVTEIFAVLTDAAGNRFSASSRPDAAAPGGAAAAGGQQFGLEIVQRYADPERASVTDIVVSATQAAEGWFWSTPERVDIVLQPDLQRGARWTRASGAPFLAAMLIFLAAFILSLWHTGNQVRLRAAYYATVVLALTFTAAMIVFISTTMQELSGSQRTDEVISLGFAHVFFGTYVAETEPEWLLSLTTPEGPHRAAQKAAEAAPPPPAEGAAATPAASAAAAAPAAAAMPPAEAGAPGEAAKAAVAVDRGFGAPLWLILLAVVGSAVFMIRLVVDSLRLSVTFTPEVVRPRMAEIIRHKVYILFAPLGAIFVYQLLVAAGGATESITVGLVSLAAGIGLNNILERAWKGTGSVIDE
jgi:hypothetical protein